MTVRDEIFAAIAEGNAALVRMPLSMYEALLQGGQIDPAAGDGWSRATIGGVPVEIRDHVDGFEIVRVTTTWSVFTEGEVVVIHNYRFRIVHIGESYAVVEPVGPVIVGQP